MKDLVGNPSNTLPIVVQGRHVFYFSHHERRNIMKLDFVVFSGAMKNWSHFQVSFSQILRATSHPEPGNS